jgi:hypothetical protein
VRGCIFQFTGIPSGVVQTCILQKEEDDDANGENAVEAAAASAEPPMVQVRWLGVLCATSAFVCLKEGTKPVCEKDLLLTPINITLTNAGNG